MGIFHFEVESKATSSWLNRNLGVLSLRIFRLSCSKDEEHSCLVLDFFSNCLGYSHDILWIFYLCTEGMMVMSKKKKPLVILSRFGFEAWSFFCFPSLIFHCTFKLISPNDSNIAKESRSSRIFENWWRPVGYRKMTCIT